MTMIRDLLKIKDKKERLQKLKEINEDGNMLSLINEGWRDLMGLHQVPEGKNKNKYSIIKTLLGSISNEIKTFKDRRLAAFVDMIMYDYYSCWPLALAWDYYLQHKKRYESHIMGFSPFPGIPHTFNAAKVGESFIFYDLMCWKDNYPHGLISTIEKEKEQNNLFKKKGALKNWYIVDSLPKLCITLRGTKMRKFLDPKDKDSLFLGNENCPQNSTKGRYEERTWLFWN